MTAPTIVVHLGKRYVHLFQQTADSKMLLGPMITWEMVPHEEAAPPAHSKTLLGPKVLIKSYKKYHLFILILYLYLY